MLACKNIQEIDLLFELLCYSLCFEKQTILCQNKLLELESCVQGEINLVVTFERNLIIRRSKMKIPLLIEKIPTSVNIMK